MEKRMEMSAKKEWFQRERTCMVCGVAFTELHNIGRLQCREHWGEIRDGYFQCCGLYAGKGNYNKRQYYQNVTPCAGMKAGCIRADHIEGISREHWGAYDGAYSCCGIDDSFYGCLNPLLQDSPKTHSMIDETTINRIQFTKTMDRDALILDNPDKAALTCKVKRYDYKAKQKMYEELLRKRCIKTNNKRF